MKSTACKSLALILTGVLGGAVPVWAQEAEVAVQNFPAATAPAPSEPLAPPLEEAQAATQAQEAPSDVQESAKDTLSVPDNETVTQSSPSWRDLIKPEDGVESAMQPDTALPVVEGLESRTSGFDQADIQSQFNGTLPAEVSKQQLQDSIRNEAYDAAITGLFPLEPEQIRMLLEHYQKTKEVAESPIASLPEPEVAVQTISLDPGVLPPTIDVAVGHVTTLNILDITGAPWPVHDVSWAGDFEVVEPQEGGHMIRITPMAEYAYGNLSIRLLTLKTPITFSLRTSREKVHYRMDARIPEYGPMAQASLIQGGTQLTAGSPLMTAVLDGAPTGTYERLEVSGVDGRTTAYKIDGQLYVRTPLSLLSPGWQSSVSSADGMNVYALNDTPVLLLSDKGNFMRATLSEKKEILDEQ